ncbi:MAG: mechanosensitive ion channel domain-containing protein [Candidatus Nanohaloarchaea archaeon]
MSHSIVHSVRSITSTALIYNLVLAVLFIAASYVVIRFASGLVRKIAFRKFGSEAVSGLLSNLSKYFMWFFVALITLSMLGFSGIASSLGTASGFVALGVAYALKDILSDTVAGVYLARDPDFEVGDEVEVDSFSGEVKEIDLRKSRLELVNGDTRVINNSDVERKWTKKN